MRHVLRLCLGITALLVLVAGCGHRYAGMYVAQVRLVEGKTETQKYPLEQVRQTQSRYGERTLELKSNGRYVLHTGDRIHEGDWWVEGNRIAIRCDTQNGRRLAAGLISEGADKYYNTRANGELFRVYDQEDSNLELVMTRQ